MKAGLWLWLCLSQTINTAEPGLPPPAPAGSQYTNLADTTETAGAGEELVSHRDIRVILSVATLHWIDLHFTFQSILSGLLSTNQGGFNCGPSSHPDFIKNYFLLKRMFREFYTSAAPDATDKYQVW